MHIIDNDGSDYETTLATLNLLVIQFFLLNPIKFQFAFFLMKHKFAFNVLGLQLEWRRRKAKFFCYVDCGLLLLGRHCIENLYKIE